MSYLLPVYGLFFLGLALAFVLFALSRSDEARPRKWARVRVWVDDNRKQGMPPPPNEELDTGPRIDWLLFSAALLLLIILVDAAS
jgi:hypothetical protein